jgi:hypothetical protein
MMLDKLKQVAPNIAFVITKEYDQYYIWDGYGDDPINDGFEPYNVTVSTMAIINGELIKGESYLG